MQALWTRRHWWSCCVGPPPTRTLLCPVGSNPKQDKGDQIFSCFVQTRLVLACVLIWHHVKIDEVICTIPNYCFWTSGILSYLYCFCYSFCGASFLSGRMGRNYNSIVSCIFCSRASLAISGQVNLLLPTKLWSDEIIFPAKCSCWHLALEICFFILWGVSCFSSVDSWSHCYDLAFQALCSFSI